MALKLRGIQGILSAGLGILPIAVCNAFLAGCTNSSSDSSSPGLLATVRTVRPELVAEYPHSENAYTQGLEFLGDDLIEGTGGSESRGMPYRENSSVRIFQGVSSEVKVERYLAPEYFGEGVTIFKDRLYQLTWLSGSVFIHTLLNGELSGTAEEVALPFASEGWGITHDDESLIMSNGSSTLYFLQPNSLQPIRELVVTLEGEPLSLLNELEYVEGVIYANVYLSSRIAAIDARTGFVAKLIDIGGLEGADSTRASASDLVANGIAYRSSSGTFFVTGKLWHTLFEVRWP